MKYFHKVIIAIVILFIFIGGCTSSQDSSISSSNSNTKCVFPTNSDNSSGHIITQRYPYVVNGQQGSIELNLNRQLRDYFACRSDEMRPLDSQENRSICFFGFCTYSNTTFDSHLELIKESKKYLALKPLVDAIKSKSTDQEMQARIAINLVQHIPFNCVEAQTIGTSNYNKFATHFDSPYEVLYENSGICGEKSALLALLLNELGYDSAYIRFNSVYHSTAGIGGSESDQYLNTGYIIIETTNPFPVGYHSDSIQQSNPEVVKLSGGSKFYLTSQDRIDSQNLQNLINKQKKGIRLSNNEVILGDNLLLKYGDQVTTCYGV